VADAIAEILRTKLLQEQIFQEAQNKFTDRLKYFQDLNPPLCDPKNAAPPSREMKDTSWSEIFNLLEAPAEQLADLDVRWLPMWRVITEFTHVSRNVCEVGRGNLSERARQLKLEGPRPLYDWEEFKVSAVSSMGGMGAGTWQGSTRNPASPQQTHSVFAPGIKDERVSNLLVDSKIFPVLKSTKVEALKTFIQALHPLMQRPEQRAAIVLKDCIADPQLADTLVQLLQHKRLLATSDLEVKHFWRNWDFFHKTLKRHLEDGTHKSIGGSDVAMGVRRELEKLQFWFRDPTNDSEMADNIRKWNHFHNWYKTIPTSGLDQAPLKKAWIHTNIKVNIPNKGKPSLLQVLLFSKAENEGAQLKSVLAMWDYIVDLVREYRGLAERAGAIGMVFPAYLPDNPKAPGKAGTDNLAAVSDEPDADELAPILTKREKPNSAKTERGADTKRQKGILCYQCGGNDHKPDACRHKASPWVNTNSAIGWMQSKSRNKMVTKYPCLAKYERIPATWKVERWLRDEAAKYYGYVCIHRDSG
jgi:hypothetical protein